MSSVLTTLQALFRDGVIVRRRLFLAGGAITTTRLSSCRRPCARSFIIVAAFVIAVRPAMVDGVRLAAQPSLTVVATARFLVSTLAASRTRFFRRCRSKIDALAATPLLVGVFVPGGRRSRGVSLVRRSHRARHLADCRGGLCVRRVHRVRHVR